MRFELKFAHRLESRVLRGFPVRTLLRIQRASLEKLQRRSHRLAQIRRVRLAADVRGARRARFRIEDFFNGGENCIVRLGVTEVCEQHRARPDLAYGIGDRPAGDEKAHARGGGAHERADRERRGPDEVEAAAAEPVAEGAERQGECRTSDHVGHHRPLHRHHPGVELLLDGRQRDVHDAHVEAGKELGRGEDHEDGLGQARRHVEGVHAGIMTYVRRSVSRMALALMAAGT